MDGVGHRHVGPPLERLLPVDLAGLGVERGEAARMPDDELPGPARLDDQGLVVAHLRPRLEGAPHLVAGVLVERHHEGVGLAADQEDDAVAVHERRARRAPDGNAGVVLGDGVLLPDHRPGRRLQAQDAPGRPRHVDPVAVDGGGGAGAGGVGEHEHPVGGGPLVRPEHLAGLLVEREQPLGAVHRPRLGLDVVEHEDAAVRDGGAGVAAVDRGPPLHGEPGVGERLENAGLGPDAPPLLAAPLRPVLGRQAGRRGQGEEAGDEGNGQREGVRAPAVGGAAERGWLHDDASSWKVRGGDRRRTDGAAPAADERRGVPPRGFGRSAAGMRRTETRPGGRTRGRHGQRRLAAPSARPILQGIGASRGGGAALRPTGPGSPRRSPARASPSGPRRRRR